MRADVIRGHLDLLVLSVVAGGATHGYAIAEELRARSGGEFDLREGTLYPALYRLEGAGLLASGWRDASGRRRRVYRLTRAGRRALEGKTKEWTAFSSAVSRVIGATSWTEPA
jgi:PadR family transcriptional regulator, regulatory protein PadR